MQASFLLTFIFSFQLPAAVGEAPTFGFTEHMANKFFKPDGVRSLTITYITVVLLILATEIFPLIGYSFCIPLGNLMKSEIEYLSDDVIKMKFLKLLLRKLHTNPSNFFLGRSPKKFRRVCVEFCKHNWATISETIFLQMLIFGK